MKKLFSKANVVLFVLALVFTVGAALIARMCGGDALTKVMCAAFAGVIGTMGIGGLATTMDWEFTESPAPGLIATIIGMVLVVLFI